MSLVHVLTSEHCPSCSGPVRELTWQEPALLFHGGYGATLHITIRACRACDWQLVHQKGSTKP